MHYIYTLFFLVLLFNEVNSAGFYRIANPRECDGMHPAALKTKRSMSPSLLRTITKKDDCVEKIRFSTPKDESKEEEDDGFQLALYGTQSQNHDMIVDEEKGLVSDSFNQDSDLLRGKLDEFSAIYLNTETGSIDHNDDSGDSKRDENVYQ